MKRVVFAVIASASFFCSVSFAAEGCTINTIQGTPTVTRNGQTEPLKAGETLIKGDLLDTPTEKCQVDMSMNDLAGCRILHGSKVEVVSWKQENMSVRIVDGNIILNLKKLPEQATFNVETPTAIAAVRGTQFWGRVNEPAGAAVTTFAVREGEVAIQPKGIEDGGPILLKPGQALDIPKDSGTFAVRPALPEEMAAMEQATAISSEAAQNAA